MGRRHIFTSGLAARAPSKAFLANKFDPHISPIKESGKSNLFFLQGRLQWLPCCQNLSGYSLWGLPQNSRLRKFWGLVREHGVLKGLPSSEWRTNFFERLGRKKTRPIFSFFSTFDPRAYASSENGPIFWRFWKISTKNQGSEIYGGAVHTTYHGSRPHPTVG